jgi:hypothetical protein
VGDAQLAAWADVIGARLDVDAAQLLPPLRAHRAVAGAPLLALTLRRRGGGRLRISVRLPHAD